MQLRDEKGAFEEDKRTQYLMNKREIDDLTQQIHEVEVFNQQVVRDHVDALSTHELNERRQQEELEQLRLENASMREQIRQATENTQKTKTRAKNDYIHDTLQYQDKFRDQAKIQQENIAIIKDQYRKV